MLKKIRTIVLSSLILLAFSVPGNSKNLFKKLKKGIKYRHSVEFKLKNMNRKLILVKIYYTNRHKKRIRKSFTLRRGSTRTFRVRKNSLVRIRYGYTGKSKKTRSIRIRSRGMKITLRGLRYRTSSRLSWLRIRNRTGKRRYVRVHYYNRIGRRVTKNFYLSKGRLRSIRVKRKSSFKIYYGRKRFGRKKIKRGIVSGSHRYVYLR